MYKLILITCFIINSYATDELTTTLNNTELINNINLNNTDTSTVSNKISNDTSSNESFVNKIESAFRHLIKRDVIANENNTKTNQSQSQSQSVTKKSQDITTTTTTTPRITQAGSPETYETIYPPDNSNETTTTTSNETFVNKVEKVFRRLIKRDIVGSLVERDTSELLYTPKITVPWEFQNEYYNLRKRKEEIEQNKRLWTNQTNIKEKYGDLIDETFQKLVNWSQDHIAFENKIIEIEKLKRHNAIHGVTFEKDPDCPDDSEDKARRVEEYDSDLKEDKSLGPEYATKSNLMEVQEKYGLEREIEELEKKMKDNPKLEKTWKNIIAIEQARNKWKEIDDKYKRIQNMKLQRKQVEEVFKKEDGDEDIVDHVDEEK